MEVKTEVESDNEADPLCLQFEKHITVKQEEFSVLTQLVPIVKVEPVEYKSDDEESKDAVMTERLIWEQGECVINSTPINRKDKKHTFKHSDNVQMRDTSDSGVDMKDRCSGNFLQDVEVVYIKEELDEDQIEYDQMYEENLETLSLEYRESSSELEHQTSNKLDRIVIHNKNLEDIRTSQSESVEEHVHLCAVCNKSFSRSDKLKRHLQIHTGQRPHVCNVCGKSFGLLHHLKQHNVVHSREKPHTCSVCNRSFKQLDGLKRHLLIHTGKRPHTCTLCGSAFTQPNNLKKHMLTHTGDGIYVCTVCNKTFNRFDCFRIHSKIHTDRPFVCHTCNRSFKLQITLREHSLDHITKDGPRACEECGETFINLLEVKKHYTVHTGEPCHVCKTCNKTFKRMSSLKTHSILHMDERPHTCSVCRVRFKGPYALKLHARTHTNK